MNFPLKDRFVTWGVPILLTGVLVALAMLQYRWSRQVSEAASTRMEASLQNSMMNFRLDFSRELATMCLELQGEDAASVDAKELFPRVEAWRRTSPLSGLISDIYEWKHSDGNERPLQRLSAVQPRFETLEEWPGNFEAAHRLLVESGSMVSASRTVERASRGKKTQVASRSSANRFAVGAIDESIPLLIVPAARSGDPVWLLIKLDSRLLQERLLAQLSERYFGDPQTAEYSIAVITAKSDRPQVLFSSGAGFGEDARVDIDSSLNLFGPPSLRTGAKQPDQPANQPTEADRSGPAFTPPAEAPLAAVAPGMAFYKIRFDAVPGPVSDQGWQIVAKHRSGSVAAAVARLHYRNLKLSFGVLLVLGASVALIVFNSQRARRLALLQMDFVIGVSHELRTPVAAILSISENIVDGVVVDEKQLLRYGGMIKNQARRLQHLVEQVLRFAAVHRRTTSYTIRRLQIPDVVDEVLENMSTMISASGITVDRKIDSDMPPVSADFGVLSQCLQNLITNAIKYGGESKWIGIRGIATTAGSPAEVSVTVADRGIGIDPNEVKHIFEPFYRSPKVMESPVPGTGLGLSLAKSFAEAMGGSLSVFSEPGKGSAFTIHLPAATGPDRELNGVTTQAVMKNLHSTMN